MLNFRLVQIIFYSNQISYLLQIVLLELTKFSKNIKHYILKDFTINIRLA